MTTRYQSAWVTITAKVYIPTDEIQDAIDGADMHECHPKTEQEAFQYLALDKINEKFASDIPLKLCEYDIDMQTYHS